MTTRNGTTTDGRQIAASRAAMDLSPNHAGSLDAMVPQARHVALDSTAALPEHPPVTSQEAFVEARRVFDALDGSNLSVSGHQWLVEVFSVSVQAQQRWVQVGLSGDHHFMLTLRLNAGAGAQPALEALSSWLGHSSRTPVNEILNVA